MNKDKLFILKKIYIGILLIIFGGIVLHAPFSVAFGTLFPDLNLVIKAWKEILMLVAGCLAIYLLYRSKKFAILNNPIILAIGAYALLHFLMILIIPTGFLATISGLMIDLRFLAYFVLVYVALRLYPDCQKLFFKVGIAGALVVFGFAVLQIFILPPDILKYLGYGPDTIAPFLTIDQNSDFIRINSTLRGPNPLGAYAAIILTFVLSAVMNDKIAKKRQPLWIVGALVFGGFAALIASYSRSAFLALLIASVIVLVIAGRKKMLLSWPALSGCLIVLSIVGAILAVNNSSFVSNVILHINPSDTNAVNSNDGHISSLSDSVRSFLLKPFGSGVGSTGSASLYTENPSIIENQYLFVANETGWLGLIVFVSIFASILMRLWEHCKNWLILGIFTSGIGLAFVGLLLPVWADDTVSIVWWGLASIAFSMIQKNDEAGIVGKFIQKRDMEKL